jgi:hypothetical protein
MSLNKRKLTEREKKYVSSTQDWKCGYCKKSLPPSYQIDHIIPFSICHNDEIDNLMALCPTCHANKTQIEYNRILQFKKLKALTNRQFVCWFCVEDDDDEHKCNRELKPIIKKQESKLNSNINSLDKFNFISSETTMQTKGNSNEKLQSITNQIMSLHLDSILHIKLQNSFIFVNSFFTPSTSFSIEEISKAVSIATRTKRDSKRYDEVEISIDIGLIGEEVGNEMVEFLNDNLPSLLPNRIFKNDEVNYTYLF